MGDQIVFSLKGDAFTALAALRSIIPTRLHQVPPPPADFTGRADELKQLLTTIERGGVTISGLQGLGGIGKTAFALKLVEQLATVLSRCAVLLSILKALAPNRCQ